MITWRRTSFEQCTKCLSKAVIVSSQKDANPAPVIIDSLSWERESVKMKNFSHPEVCSCGWAPELASRMQLAPEGWRGYIEMLPVRKISN